ncbi:hypothetical protein F5Y16DRAFT_3020 [Xylariaceae sp. FL0255]|nr:hypothetical protein F5Y16DRAFT_3020 [Xylariaceae sp. FL0255]
MVFEDNPAHWKNNFRTTSYTSEERDAGLWLLHASMKYHTIDPLCPHCLRQIFHSQIFKKYHLSYEHPIQSSLAPNATNLNKVRRREVYPALIGLLATNVIAFYLVELKHQDSIGPLWLAELIESNPTNVGTVMQVISYLLRIVDVSALSLILRNPGTVERVSFAQVVNIESRIAPKICTWSKRRSADIRTPKNVKLQWL